MSIYSLGTGIVTRIKGKVKCELTCIYFRYGRPEESCHQDTFLEMNKKIRTVQEQVDTFRENFDTVKTLQAEIQFLNAALQVSDISMTS